MSQNQDYKTIITTLEALGVNTQERYSKEPVALKPLKLPKLRPKAMAVVKSKHTAKLVKEWQEAEAKARVKAEAYRQKYLEKKRRESTNADNK